MGLYPGGLITGRVFAFEEINKSSLFITVRYRGFTILFKTTQLHSYMTSELLEKSQSVASDSALLASFLLSLLLSIKENGY